jgi:alpha-N-arabinofuranosidase
MELCKLIRARPYLAGNLGSGTPGELHDWVEYCNNPFGSTLADERMTNGAPGPFGVKFWGIGNESWGCGGHLNAEEYCALYSRFATYIPTYGGTKPYLIAVGPESNDLEWTRRFFSTLRTTRRYAAPLHGYAMHFYSWGKSKPTEYTRETLKHQLDQVATLEQAILDQCSLLDTFATDPKSGRIGLIIDEWGTWDVSDEEVENQRGKFWQQNTMKDAVAAGLALNVFHRQCDKLTMCNLAQTINVLQAPILASDDKCLRTPTYYAFLLCVKHRGNTSVRIDQALPQDLSLSASRSARDLVVTAVNPDPDHEVEFMCTIDGPRATGASGQMLHHKDWNSYNSFDAPDTIVPLPVPVHRSEHNFTVELPPFSLATLIIQLSD